MGRHHAFKSHHLYLPPPPVNASPLQLLKTSYNSPSAILSTSSISATSVGSRIPGFKVSAGRNNNVVCKLPKLIISALAFLSNLHSNIFIELDSSYDSSDETPYFSRPTIYDYQSSPLIQSMSSLTAADLAPPSALRVPDQAADEIEDTKEPEVTVGEDGLPILKTFSAETDELRAEALHIIADSVAQQRNVGSQSLIYHPVSFVILAIAIAALKKIYTDDGEINWVMICTTGVGVIMSLLGGVRLMLGPYIFEAERVGTWKWMNEGRSAEDEEENGFRVLGERDEILMTQFGDEYIGAIVFRAIQPITPPASPNANKRTRRAQSLSKTNNKMVIRAWSVKQKYRRKEVGSALLEDAIKFGMEKGWTTEGVEFAEDHANHKRVLPKMFNGALDRFTDIALKTLNKKINELGIDQEKDRKKR